MNFIRTATFATTILCLGTMSATAGGLAEPVMVMEPEEIAAVVAPSSSSAEIIIPLILIALITVAMSGSGDGGTSEVLIAD